MLFVELSLVEHLIVKAGIFRLNSCLRGGGGVFFLVMERATSGYGLLLFPGGGGQFASLACGVARSRCMGAHLSRGARRGKDTMFFVYLLYVGGTREAGVACNNFLRAHVERRAHNRASSRTLCEGRERGVAAGDGCGESAESVCGSRAQEGAGSLEPCERGELVHWMGEQGARVLPIFFYISLA